MKRRTAGSILLMTLVFLLLAVPMVLFLMQFLQTQLKQANREKKIFAAHDLPQNALVDYMRQFAQNPSINWNDLAQFNRPDAFYAAGFQTMTATPDTTNHRVQISATGVFDPFHTGRGVRKGMDAWLGFSSNLFSFAKVSLGMTISANGRTFGPTYADSISVTGSNNVFSGNVESSGRITLNGSTRVNGNIYCGGVYSGPAQGSVNFPGILFNYAPPVTLPNPDFTYWLAQSNINPWANPVATITFRIDNAGLGWVRIKDGFGTNNYRTDSPGGVVIVTDGRASLIGNNDLSSQNGKVHGHITLVASTVTIRNSLVYANGTQQSDANDSLAVLSFNPIQLIKSDVNVDTMVVTSALWTFYRGPTNCPLFYAAGTFVNGSSGIVCRWLNLGPGGQNAARLDIFGVSSTGLNRVCDNWDGNSHTCACANNFQLPIYEWGDPNMSQFTPPGFPSRCTILSYTESNQ